MITQVFQLYSNLLMDEVGRPWSKIIGEQIEVAPWTDLFVEHTKEHKKLWQSFIDCIFFHLLTVFQSDVAETQGFYISNRLKKLSQVLIRQFMQRIQQLISFWTYCPSFLLGMRNQAHLGGTGLQ